jgi:hypothetical protein
MPDAKKIALAIVIFAVATAFILLSSNELGKYAQNKCLNSSPSDLECYPRVMPNEAVGRCTGIQGSVCASEGGLASNEKDCQDLGCTWVKEDVSPVIDDKVCVDGFSRTCNDEKNNYMSLLSLILGAVFLASGLLIRKNGTISAGVISAGGVGIVAALIMYWENINTMLRIALSFIILLVLLVIAWWKFKDE